jgi:diguanylate cyclase (GGDEF)-like protein
LEQHCKDVISCPVGKTDCPLIAEIERLKEQYEHLKKEYDRVAALSQCDPLTGIFNFQYLQVSLEREMERTRRTGFPLAVIMIDLDYFKKINDTYGHQAGNAALRWVSRLWRDSIRVNDILCRYGGEEFTLILPATSLRKAVLTAHRLRTILADAGFEFDGREIRLTASFGVEVYKATDKFDADEFIKRADKYLLEAKTKGRNCVCSQQDEGTDAGSEVLPEERAALFITRWQISG